jgi:GntR family transcriptional regulator, gluconate operon transcriptional repressor
VEDQRPERSTYSGLRPIRPSPSLAEGAADLIRHEILAGGFAQGERLVEARIAERLDVSRGPVREAFKLLRAEGLLQEERRKGTFVVSIRTSDVREIYGVRAAIEGRAAKLVATSQETSSLGMLRRLYERMEHAADDRDVAEVFARDLDFHDGLCRLSGNGRLHEVFVRYVPMLRALLRVDERASESPMTIAREHLPLLEAIESGNVPHAVALAEHHCDHAATMISNNLDALRVRARSAPQKS